MGEMETESIRGPESIARLSHTFSRSLTAGDLAQPLHSLDDNQPVELARELMAPRGLSVLGVRSGGLMAGWVGAGDLTGGRLRERARAFAPGEVVDESASLGAVLSALATADHLFVRSRGDVVWVITRRELQHPPLRMWLFGAITVLEANMTWAIDALHPKEAWTRLVSAGRLEKAVALRELRRESGSECRLVDCLQIKDKADILVSNREHLALLGLGSRRETSRLVREIEGLRNQLAHSQALEARHLAAATRLAASIDSILNEEYVRRIVGKQRGRGE
jgi:hypothetical protein